jgi:retron-type reverse transcriptase
MLKIPTIADRAWQCLIKLALEPAHEAWFHERSYGFRPGRSTHDAQKILFLHLNSSSKGYNKKVIELEKNASTESIIKRFLTSQLRHNGSKTV